eukprot:GSChrysophyteH1.ASY1.ANO1.3179.1 assembled CDS
MEDVHRVVKSLKGSPEYSYFGVYDGHGGRQIADFLEETLESNISVELQQPDDASILERLQRAYLITDMQSRRLNIVTSGATAVSALLRTEHRADSSTPADSSSGSDIRPHLTESAYLAYRLTYDHRAEDELEQKRIEAAGGFITRGRVLGILAVSRSFGDHGMKDFVSADPFMSEVDLTNVDAPFLIIACDGVWDVFTDQEAVELIYEEYEKEGCAPFKYAAEMLVQASIERGSADNITVIVIFL